ncbi:MULTISPECIES: carbohydrate ABC transporter permease [Paenibacillus]|uniref:Carbohydrate ABC transporter permease n=2 Tax=Paenibacillus TaxID=44249 RepID=A0ABU6D8T0_9BACL|nr:MULTISPECIES: carbohydrate ABC transporter permease [Paenibacillus]MBA2942589.1 carbohydrate ABC transporter permease [Paenibacillus sp. CGMCC 1.16610]MCY9661750.1 carbohydrate ABC transporter permease [Paenibacillus anseongense]MEB4793835.1 carbohydrate ABC transporter permease [Paenibacillus chondroitinus]MVQ35403.1 ABC transporter permease subunit [Paenibacillus anseongense]
MKRTVSFIFKIALLLVFIFPFLWMISTSLQSYDEIMTFPPTMVPAMPQWKNFTDAMGTGPFLTYTRNSVIVTLSVIVLQVIVMIPAAYAFAKYNFYGKGILFGMVLLAFMIPGQVTFIPVYLMLADWGLIKSLLPQIIPFMSNAFGIFLLRQYFMQTPEEIIEAARIDNASEFRIMWNILTPMAMPALATVVLFSFVSHWNDYFWPLVMTDSTPVRPLTIGISMLKETEGVNNWNILMAANVVLVIPILIVYAFCSKYIVKAFVYSGIK